MKFMGWFSAGLVLFTLFLESSHAVEFLDTGDPEHNTKTPGDNSGWQYMGQFTYSMGVPIAPLYFITAKHVGGTDGETFYFHGDAYSTTAHYDIGSSDLRIWKVAAAKPFKTWAPIASTAPAESALVTVIGRGTERGAEIVVNSQLKGWENGISNNRARWGRNLVTEVRDGGSVGELVYCQFDQPGIPNECALTIGDSGGAMFVFEQGLWRLSAINFAVDGEFRKPSTTTAFTAALFDIGGLEMVSSDGQSWVLIPDQNENIPSGFYGSEISSNLPDLLPIISDLGSLAPENYAAWQTLYFAPSEIGNPAITGPLADFDVDGISNLLEFALNLDPTFHESVMMEADIGFRGLPLVRLETIDDINHLTIEFVRRTVGSGSNLTCIAKFSSDLATWVAGGSESVTPINDRWERVKVVDGGAYPSRFARVEVSMAD